ncbi:Transmembrane protein 245 [Hypsibius exemplaris]|uniref:Transmembrane protein 245 n=1 Tax=Hypsibius exemplaris TaxID=2072580 RepID=A0A1W0WWM2_HYPEX|nr:Transmembrane protein 245 [Hypsibius exemplaris]
MSKESAGINMRNIGANVVAFGSRNTDLAVRVAIFTAAAHCCLGLLFVAGFQVYVILETFVRPLMWALLTGTFLFPFKSFLADLVKEWLRNLHSTSTPILAAFAFTPLGLLDRALDYIGAEVVDFFRHHGWKFIYTVAAVVGYFFLYFWLSPYLGFLGSILKYSLWITTALSTNMVWLIIIPYGLALHVFWTSGYRRYLLYAAIPLWILIGFYGYFLLDELAVPVYLFVAVTIGLGYSESPASATKIPRVNSANTMRRGTIVHHAVVQTPSVKTLPSTRQTLSSVAESPPSSEENDNKTTVVDDVASSSDGPSSKPSSRLMNVIGDHTTTRVGWRMLKQSYKNVAEVLTDENYTHNTDEEKADAEAIRNTLKDLGVGGDAAGTRYLIYVFWMFFLLEALTSFYVIPLILIPVCYRVIKILFRTQNVQPKLKTFLEPLRVQFGLWTDDRAEVVAPSIIKSLITYAKIGDRKVLSIIGSVTDETVSAILILLMFVIASIGGVIAMLQIEQESSYLIAVTGTMMDNTFRNNPELYEWLPEADEFKEHIQNGLDSAYLYGRDLAIKTIRSTIADTNETRVAEIEQDLSTIADRFYSYYVQKNASASIPLTDPNKGLGSLLGVQLGDPLTWLQAATENGTNPLDSVWNFDLDLLTDAAKYLDVSLIQEFLKKHVDTFVSVLESVWAILKGNIALITTVTMTVASVTFTYFSAFLNFILCTVVYLTGLFYLLSSSGKRYRPIELISAAGQYFSGADTFAEIVEDTISGIFAVSFKIGTFYGFYTWVLLSFCGVYVRFIPSVLAALFAVCPLVPSYAVCFPAALNMWLRGDYITLIILCAGSYVPKLFVDAAIYGDLKTANPYMFGLSVAGGLVTLGIEGAVIGPMALCFLIIVIESYKIVIQSRFLETGAATVEQNGQATTSH